jgi:2-polyprenyl-6-methoxyphenol hydroxylase-like FAD-dependent oxidoreductase
VGLGIESPLGGFEFEGNPGEVHWRMAVRFERRLAARFGTGHLWLAGDAGHMTGPAAAQSMNVGLREGLELADIMTGQLRVGEEPERLVAYERSRQEEWHRLLGIDSQVVAGAKANDWIRANADRVVTCLPASGASLDAALGRLGLRWT